MRVAIILLALTATAKAERIMAHRSAAQTICSGMLLRDDSARIKNENDKNAYQARRKWCAEKVLR